MAASVFDEVVFGCDTEFNRQKWEGKKMCNKLRDFWKTGQRSLDLLNF